MVRTRDGHLGLGGGTNFALTGEQFDNYAGVHLTTNGGDENGGVGGGGLVVGGTRGVGNGGGNGAAGGLIRKTRIRIRCLSLSE